MGKRLLAFLRREQLILCSIVVWDGTFMFAVLPPTVWRSHTVGCVVLAVVATAVIVSLANLIAFLVRGVLC